MRNLLFLLFAVGGLSSCVSTHYEHMRNYTLPSRDRAVAYEGSATTYYDLRTQAQAPHLSESEKRRLSKEAFASIPKQIGSEDYYISGYIRSTGEDVSLANLKARMLKRGAKEGGDVVFFFNSGQRSQPWSYTTPGYSTTNTYGQANAYASPNGNGYNVNAYGTSTSNTTYTPPQTYSGSTLHVMAEGFVLRYEPGFADRSARFDAVFATEAGRAEIIKELSPNAANQLPTQEEYRSKLMSIIEHHEEVNPELRVTD